MMPNQRFRFVALALPLAVGLAACSRTPPAAESDVAPAIAVTTSTVRQMDWPAQFDAGGVLRARTTATISSRILAPVLSVRVRPGDRVRLGQTLIELEAASLVAEASRASASVKSGSEAVTAASADVDNATSALTLAGATHTRIARLHADRAATTQELDEAVAALAGAESRLKGARARHAEAIAGLEALSAARLAATTGASYRTLAAPFDGVVTERTIDPGSMATPGTPLLVVESPAALQLDLRIDASRAAFITVGQAVEVHIDTDAAGTAGRSGRVSEISRIDAGAHSFGVKIDVATSAGWRSGLFGRARFTGRPRMTLVIPEAAVIRRGQLSFVFVASADGRARLRAISLGETAASDVEVLDGLTAGEAVLLTPPPALADGTRVTVSGAGR